MQRLCEEINDTVQESGQVSVAELSKNLGLPNSFLVEVYSVYIFILSLGCRPNHQMFMLQLI